MTSGQQAGASGAEGAGAAGSGSLSPELSRLLVRMSKPQGGDVFLDPFAGSGALCRARAEWPARRVIGVDPDVVFFRHRRNLLDDTQMQWLRDVAEASRYRCLSDQMTWLDEEEKEAVRAFLATEDEPLEILGRYRFKLGEREIDLTEAIEGAPSAYPL